MKKEELKKQLNEVVDSLDDEQLENVNGGGIIDLFTKLVLNNQKNSQGNGIKGIHYINDPNSCDPIA